MEYFWLIISIIIIFLLVEIFTYSIVKYVNKKFQWLIIQKDEFPKLSKDGLKKFIQKGYDPELGWVRKPNTHGIENVKRGFTKWNINSKGSRVNPNFENYSSKISCYGDSFVFGRQVNDDETWEHYLSKNLKTNVQNFGVGNYGIDQAFLRLKREFIKNKTEIVILGVVPDTIRRNLNIWKHYFEYGNTFGFKPRFKIEKNKLKLVKNFIDKEEKFSEYEKFLNEIRVEDYFYSRKFLQEKIAFPYSISIFKNFRRNYKIIFQVLKKELIKKNTQINPMEIIMEINQKWTTKLFENLMATNLLKRILEEYSSYSKKLNFKAVFIFLPQKNDLLFIKNNYNFLENFINDISKNHQLIIIDIINELLSYPNLDELFSDDSKYGGHFSKKGNLKVAEIIGEKLNKIL